MIDALNFRSAWRGFQARELIHFREGVNLLVGDQGCGKSTVLQGVAAIADVDKAFFLRDPKAAEHVFVAVDGQRRLVAHDFLYDNPQTASAFEVRGMLPLDVAVGQRMMSHGQASRQTLDLLLSVRDAYVLLDEPDTGLSPRSVLCLIESLMQAAQNGCQVLASVHHPWIIEAFPTVISLEHGRSRMPSAAFLASQRDLHPPPRDPNKARFPVQDLESIYARAATL